MNTLWWTNILPWKITIFYGKIHYKWPFFMGTSTINVQKSPGFAQHPTGPTSPTWSNRDAQRVAGTPWTPQRPPARMARMTPSSLWAPRQITGKIWMTILTLHIFTLYNCHDNCHCFGCLRCCWTCFFCCVSLKQTRPATCQRLGKTLGSKLERQRLGPHLVPSDPMKWCVRVGSSRSAQETGRSSCTLWWTYKKLLKMAIYSGFSH